MTPFWRVLHPDTSGFTWRRHRQRIQCILDFFLVSQSTVILRGLTDTVPGYQKDRSMITLRLSLHSNLRGPGFWKLNISFLTELEYINQIETTIQETYDEHKNDESVNPSLLWEMIKLEVREKSRNRPNNAKYMWNKQLPDYKRNLTTKLLETRSFHTWWNN